MTDTPQGTTQQDERPTFYSGLGIAALLCLLVRNAKQGASRNFGSFANQLTEWNTLADQMIQDGDEHAELFKAIAEQTAVAFDKDPTLFNKAHLAIFELLTSLKPINEWGPCAHASHESIRLLVSMNNV